MSGGQVSVRGDRLRIRGNGAQDNLKFLIEVGNNSMSESASTPLKHSRFNTNPFSQDY
jgi:hypothetical protein